MTAPGLAAAGRAREVNWLGKAMGTADDAALQRVVSILDGMRNRGDADAVLEQARKRLRVLRPPRPLGFARLLFLPLDGAIVPSARWRRGEALLPRGALAGLAAAVHQGLGSRAAPIFEACEGRTTAETVAIRRIGATLWPAAPDALPQQPPADWATTGLAAADYPAVAALCRPLWAQGAALWEAVAAAAEGPPDGLVEAALVGLLPAGPKPLAAALATLLANASAPGRVAQVAARLDPLARPVALQALDAMLDQPMPELDQLDIRSATEASLALARRLDDLAQCSLLGVDRQRRVHTLRRAAEEACRGRFMAAAELQLLMPAMRLAVAEQVQDAEVTAIETGARELRGLEGAGRRLGGGQAYDRALRAMGETLTALATRATQPDGLRPIDLARMLEILAGPDAGAALLPRAATAA